MSEQQHEQEHKVDVQRKARRDRLKQENKKTGRKQPIQQGSRVSRLMYPIICIVLVLIVAIWIFFSMGVAQKFAAPISIGNHKVSVLEYNFYYKNTVAQFTQTGMIANGPDGRPNLSAASNIDPNLTWEQYFKKQTNETIQDTYVRALLAEKAGQKLSEASETEINTFFERLKQQSGSDVDYHNALVDRFGQGASEDALRPILNRMFLATDYTRSHPKEIKVTNDDVKAYYEEHKDDFDFVAYHTVMVQPIKKVEAQTDEAGQQGSKAQFTDEEKAEAKQKAEEILAKSTSEDAYITAAKDFVATWSDDERNALMNAATNKDDVTYRKDVRSSIANKEVADWLFNAERKGGDKAVIESGNYYFVVYYIAREQDNEHLPSVRHILFGTQVTAAGQTGGETPAIDPAKIDESAKQKAEETLAKIQTEEDMQKLGDTLKAQGQVRESAEYNNVAVGQMVPEFNDWIFDPARKPGDKGIVKTTFGYHVMYFKQFSDQPSWYLKAESGLQGTKFNEELEAAKKDAAYAITEHAFGMRFVKA